MLWHCRDYWKDFVEADEVSLTSALQYLRLAHFSAGREEAPSNFSSKSQFRSSSKQSKLWCLVQVKGYKSTSESTVPGLPFLIAIVAGLIVATVVVSSQTAGGPPPQSSPDSQASPAAAVQE